MGKLSCNNEKLPRYFFFFSPLPGAVLSFRIKVQIHFYHTFRTKLSVTELWFEFLAAASYKNTIQ